LIRRKVTPCHPKTWRILIVTQIKRISQEVRVEVLASFFVGVELLLRGIIMPKQRLGRVSRWQDFME